MVVGVAESESGVGVRSTLMTPESEYRSTKSCFTPKACNKCLSNFMICICTFSGQFFMSLGEKYLAIRKVLPPTPVNIREKYTVQFANAVSFMVVNFECDNTFEAVPETWCFRPPSKSGLNPSVAIPPILVAVRISVP